MDDVPQSWHFKPVHVRKSKAGGARESWLDSRNEDESSDDCQSDMTTTPPLLARMAGDPEALCKWASLAMVEIRGLKLGHRHAVLQATALRHEGERLERELGNEKAAKSQVWINLLL